MAHSVCWLVVCGRRDCSNNGKGQAALGRRGTSKKVGTGARDESGSRFGFPHPGLRFHRGGQVGSALGDLPRAGPYLATNNDNDNNNDNPPTTATTTGPRGRRGHAGGHASLGRGRGSDHRSLDLRPSVRVGRMLTPDLAG